jgi:Ca2+-binding EF-hand superfamily protein
MNTPVKEERKSPPPRTGKIQPEDTHTEDPKQPPPSELDQIPYIDFEQFAMYLSVFCPKCPYDLKTDCTSHLVLFRLYDIDGDGMLNMQDVAGVLKLIVGESMPVPQIEEIVKKVFKEVDTAEKGYIEKDEFRKVMWITDFDQKTSIHF